MRGYISGNKKCLSPFSCLSGSESVFCFPPRCRVKRVMGWEYIMGALAAAAAAADWITCSHDSSTTSVISGRKSEEEKGALETYTAQKMGVVRPELISGPKE